jgi:DNA polymerase/3'-5' exonuclease PolX
MTVFDQRGQHVKYQYNIAGAIDLEAVQSKAQLIEQLEKLQAELARATREGALDVDHGFNAKAEVEKAAELAQMPEPDKGKILGYLDRAREMVTEVATTVTATTGLVVALQKAMELAQKLF